MLGHELAMALRAAYLALHRRTEAIMTRLGVTADQFVILHALAENAALSQRELTDRTATDANTLSAMLGLLERKELIQRVRDPGDGRVRRVALTNRGRLCFDEMYRQSEPLREELVNALSHDDAAMLAVKLKSLADKLREGSQVVRATKRSTTRRN